ncbi:MAG: HXXEE domain-containing protein [Bryobacteraceae bacterium]
MDIERTWPRITLPLAVAVAMTAPVAHARGGWPLALTWLQLAAYAVHQYEEHGRGAFKAYANRLYGDGREVLGDRAICVINTAGVWGIDSLAFAAACLWGPGAGVTAVYLSLVNAVSHIAGAVRTREYNPGLWTAMGVFVPLGGYTLAELGSLGFVSPFQHAFGALVSIAIHAGIVAHVMRNRAAHTG